MKLQGKEWINVWTGTWSFLSCTHFADQYSKEVKIKGKVPFPETIIFLKKKKVLAGLLNKLEMTSVLM